MRKTSKWWPYNATWKINMNTVHTLLNPCRISNIPHCPWLAPFNPSVWPEQIASETSPPNEQTRLGTSSSTQPTDRNTVAGCWLLWSLAKDRLLNKVGDNRDPGSTILMGRIWHQHLSCLLQSTRTSFSLIFPRCFLKNWPVITRRASGQLRYW